MAKRNGKETWIIDSRIKCSVKIHLQDFSRKSAQIYKHVSQCIECNKLSPPLPAVFFIQQGKSVQEYLSSNRLEIIVLSIQNSHTWTKWQWCHSPIQSKRQKVATFLNLNENSFRKQENYTISLWHWSEFSPQIDLKIVSTFSER